MDLALLALIGGAALLFSVFLSKGMYKWGVPTLIIFLALGMIFGNSYFGIDFGDANMVSNIASFGLLVIIFSGGFDTNWIKAKHNYKISIVLASLGVFLTAGFVGVFTYLILPDFTWLESLLIGAIISSTDAAAVFSILRSKKLNFKNNAGPLLEMESGSNDPSAYMITVILITLITGFTGNVFLEVSKIFLLQVVVGLGLGFLIGFLGVKVINKIKLEIDGLYIILGLGLMLLSFGAAENLYGNGYLAVYATGILIGNSKIVHKPSLMQFFDGLSWLAQILLFFTLGLFVSPSLLVKAAIPGILIALFITFIARPLAVIPIMTAFKKPIKDSLLVSWVGFRGAASIVFAIMVLAQIGGEKGTLIFDIVFVVAIVSVLLQGLLLVPVAKKLDMTQDEETELKVFTDYSGASYTDILEVIIEPTNVVVGKKIKDLAIPDDILIMLIKRDDQMIPPRGNQEICANDILLLAGQTRQSLLKADIAIKEINNSNGNNDEK